MVLAVTEPRWLRRWATVLHPQWVLLSHRCSTGMPAIAPQDTEIAIQSGNSAHQSLVDATVGDMRRLKALRRTQLLDTAQEEPFDRIARLASSLLGTPIATVTLIDSDRQFYKSALGLPEPVKSDRETPLDLSFCRHTVALGTPLVIADTRADERVNMMPSVREHGILAYAGVPLILDQSAIGTLCVMDFTPRQWTDEQVGVLRDLGAMVMTEIELRTTVSDLDVAVAAAEAARKEAERANRAKSEFVAMMSHDLRTPLNAIGGYRQLLELGVHGPVNEGQLQALSRIKRAQDHLSYLINEVMDFARLESGSVSLDLSEVSVESVLKRLEELIRPQLDEKQLTYVLAGGSGSTRMLADSEKVVRILTNLLTNAIKFTEPGGTITLGWVPGDEFVDITVTDSGIGIPADKIESVFEPFVQVPGQKKMNPQGVGLGLAIGRKLARLMGGDLTASAAPLKGTTFSMTVPRAESSAKTK